nr:MAG TPA: hypothetical protein [Crassvirales sp.]
MWNISITIFSIFTIFTIQAVFSVYTILSFYIYRINIFCVVRNNSGEFSSR